MREVQRSQAWIGQVPIDQIEIDPTCRDDNPALLKGLQDIWSNEPVRERLFDLLDQNILPKTDRTVGRPGMELWQILVLGVLKQGLNCDFDRIHHIANNCNLVRQFLGHGVFDSDKRYKRQTIMDNVSYLTPELLDEVNQIVVERGHEVAGKDPDETLRGRCDSFVVETDVHHPTDLNLLWDATRCGIREAGKASERFKLERWRQWRHLIGKIKQHFNRTRLGRKKKYDTEAVKAFLELCGTLMARVEETRILLTDNELAQKEAKTLEDLITHARRQSTQIERRVLCDDKIPHGEKVFSIFEPHTRWISRGKAGTPFELGVPVAIVEDQFQFILGHTILWEEQDVHVAVPLIKATQERFPQLRQCSFDRGFHSPANQKKLAEMLDTCVLPKKGRLSKADRERQENPKFVAGQKSHPAVESAINGLEHRGLDLVRTHGKEGFARTVALSILATNLYRIGSILQKRVRKRWRRAA